MKDLKARVNQAISTIQANDPALAGEFHEVRNRKDVKEEARNLAPMMEAFEGGLENSRTGSALETIVLRVGRPVLTVFNDEAILEFKEAESQVWKERLTKARTQLATAIKAVGRIEIENHPSFEWVGTAWLVDKNIVVTNRHVAELFGRSNGTSFIFRQGSGNRIMTASIDFVEELNRTDDSTFRLEKILFIEDEDGPDIAFLLVQPIETGRRLADYIRLATDIIKGKPNVAVIGYPARDSRIPDQQLMTDIFGDVYNKKRLAPGQITGFTSTELFHDCSTLGGNSGSVIFDLESGKALGIHFAGRFLETNFAVPASFILERLRKFSETSTPSAPTQTNGKQTPQGTSVASLQSFQTQAPSSTVNFTIPLQISVSIGTPVQHSGAEQKVKPAPATSVNIPGNVDDDELIATEATPADYANRNGYIATFLGPNAELPLPTIGSKLTDDVLTFELNNQTQLVLKYQHFSVVMSRSRRLCLFSAVNIDGKSSTKRKRVGWRLDPRIPADAQIMKECYGNFPKFSRGHMTRREDPVWGNIDEASEGNSDSMHVTNTVPQLQPFNAPIWLSLEDYALDHCREDNMKISVFTGPILRDDDEPEFGVKIPVTFWKIIAFVHDETKQLCATGYIMSQKDLLRKEEFIFGQHDHAQLPIKTIEELTGLSFGQLVSVDPLGKSQEAPIARLTDLKQIRFI